jgi:putative addiction module component (TIGR02574 family)
MGELPNKLLQEALKLSTEERAALATALLATLDGPADPDLEAAWVAEIERRLVEIDTGTLKPVPWPEARASILRR